MRYEDNADCIAELESTKEMAAQFCANSGDLFKLVGVLRAADIYWNPATRYQQF